MNKREFMERLAYELGNIDAGTKAEILNDFREHFEIAENSGKTEEEICDILGDPREIAGEFIRGYGQSSEPVVREQALPPLKSIIRDVLDNIPFTQSGGWKSRQRADDGAPFIGQLSPDGIIAIRLELKHSDIEIHGEPVDFIRLDFENEYAKQSFFSDVSPDGVYYVKEVSLANARLKLTVPIDFKGLIDIKTGGGDVCAERLVGLKGYKLHTGSGNCRAKSVKAGIFKAKTGSGDINVEDTYSDNGFIVGAGSGDIRLLSCESPEGFNVSTGSGDVESEGCAGNMKTSTGSGNIWVDKHSGTVWATTGSGDIEVDTDEIANDISYSTGSGEIVIRCRRLGGNIRMTSGSGNISLSAWEVNGDISSKSGSGNVKIALGSHSDVKFQLKAGSSGRIQNAFADIHRENARHTVKLETHSGNVTIREIKN